MKKVMAIEKTTLMWFMKRFRLWLKYKTNTKNIPWFKKKKWAWSAINWGSINLFKSYTKTATIWHQICFCPRTTSLTSLIIKVSEISLFWKIPLFMTMPNINKCALIKMLPSTKQQDQTTISKILQNYSKSQNYKRTHYRILKKPRSFKC